MGDDVFGKEFSRGDCPEDAVLVLDWGILYLLIRRSQNLPQIYQLAFDFRI